MIRLNAAISACDKGFAQHRLQHTVSPFRREKMWQSRTRRILMIITTNVARRNSIIFDRLRLISFNAAIA
eukprot:7037387-Karenia_brevis.AAC.1